MTDQPTPAPPPPSSSSTPLSDQAAAVYAPQRTAAHRDEPGNVRLLTLKSGGWVLLLALLMMIVVGAWLAILAATNRRDVVGDGRSLATFGFALDRLAIARDMLHPFGQPRDYRPVLDEPLAVPALVDPRSQPRFDMETVNSKLWGKYVVPSDRVIAVELHGKARAYPLRILAAHEIVNDVLGGVPIAVTYSPMADTVAVFDRRVAGPGSDAQAAEPAVLQFGLSGLMVNQGLVMYDRQAGGPYSGTESLWLQLPGQAISGPRVGTKLRLLPSQVVPYQQFVARYTETLRWTDENGKEHTAPVTPQASVMVVEGIARWVRGEDFGPVLDKQYRYFLEAYRREDQTDALSYPVAPLPPLAEGEQMKERLIAVHVPGLAEPVVVSHAAVLAGSGPSPRLVRQAGEVTLSFTAIRNSIHGDTVVVEAEPAEIQSELGIVHTFRYAWYAAQHLPQPSAE